MGSIRFLWAAITLAAAVWGQAPADVTVTLAAKDGRTVFRMGEAIPVDLRFQASVPWKYGIWLIGAERIGRVPAYDHFLADPAEGTVDPLADTTETGARQQGGREVDSIGDTPVGVGLIVNEWVSFRRPGRYRITVETARAFRWARGPQGPGLVRASAIEEIPTLRSNTVAIEVIAAEPGWAEEQLKQAVAVLEGPRAKLTDMPQGPYEVGGPLDPRRRFPSVENAARTLRFLETPEAARALARLFVDNARIGITALRWSPEAPELIAGLWATPYRKEVIAAMEEAGFPSNSEFGRTLGELKYAASHAPGR